MTTVAQMSEWMQTLPQDAEVECGIDSDSRGPEFHSGDRVLVIPNGMTATVVKQLLHFDYPESFWGNVELLYDDGVTGTSMCWQLKKVE